MCMIVPVRACVRACMAGLIDLIAVVAFVEAADAADAPAASAVYVLCACSALVCVSASVHGLARALASACICARVRV